MHTYWTVIAIAVVGCLINPSMGVGVALGAVFMLWGSK